MKGITFLMFVALACLLWAADWLLYHHLAASQKPAITQPAACPLINRTTVVYKLYRPGRSYIMRAQTGTATLTMPATTPAICKLVCFVQHGQKDTVITLTVTDSLYPHYNVLDTINLKNYVQNY